MVWFILWRGYIFMLVLGLFGALASVLFGSDPIGVTIVVTIYIVEVSVVVLWAFPGFMRLMVQKQFSGFRLEINRTESN